MDKIKNITPEELEKLAKAEYRKYKAEWRKNNKDEVRESNKKYWIKKAIEKLEREGAERNDEH